jgi:hypothetical protein
VLILQFAGLEEAKNLAGREALRPDSRSACDAEFGKNLANLSNQLRKRDRRFEFEKRGQLFI